MAGAVLKNSSIPTAEHFAPVSCRKVGQVMYKAGQQSVLACRTVEVHYQVNKDLLLSTIPAEAKKTRFLVEKRRCGARIMPAASVGCMPM